MRTLVASLCLLAVTWTSASAGEPAKTGLLTADEIKVELAKETPEQKALRAELEALAKAGQKIAFSTGTPIDGKGGTYLVGPDGSGLKFVTGKGGYPHLSADGKKVVYGRNGWGKPEKDEVLAKLPCDPRFPTTRADRLRAREGGGVICVTDIEAGSENEEVVAQGTLPHYSPDGRKIVYSVPFGNQRTMWKPAILEVATRKETVLDRVQQVTMFACFTPDGRQLLFSNCGAAQCANLNAEGTGLAEPLKMTRLGVSPDGGCNLEVSKDGKWVCWVVDTYGEAGGWLHCAAFADGKASNSRKLELGWNDNSVNYYPDFSPDSKYLVYSHAENQPGVASYSIQSRQDLYVTRFPDCKATVRITWTNASCSHPHWWGPAAK
jgi:Tol biopolymer transport system component